MTTLAIDGTHYDMQTVWAIRRLEDRIGELLWEVHEAKLEIQRLKGAAASATVDQGTHNVQVR